MSLPQSPNDLGGGISNRIPPPPLPLPANAHTPHIGSDVPSNAQSKPPTRKRRSRFIRIATVALISALFAGTVTSIVLAQRWSQYSTQVDAANVRLGEQISQTLADLDSAKASLSSTRDQLATAQKRISQLATEKAQVGDDRENQRILAQDTAAIANEALSTSQDLGQCVSQQTDLVSQLSNILTDQNSLLVQYNLSPSQRDTQVISEITQSISRSRSELLESQTAASDTCADAVKRFNSLINSLED